jgi:pimeloyl-ACP methyl ester carboxylesterase
MPVSIILVHGAWHGAWVWDAVAERLRAAGRRVLVPTLQASGERAEEPAEPVTLDTQVAELAELIESEAPARVVLVAHSLAGVHATLLANRMPERIERLVLLDAEVPQDGECALGALPIAEEYQGMIETFRVEDNRLAPLPVEFFGLPEGPLRDAQAAALRPHPERPFTDPVHLSAEPLNGLATTYVLATDPPSEDGKLRPIAERLAHQSNVKLVEFPASHMMLLSHPNEIAALILDGEQG